MGFRALATCILLIIIGVSCSKPGQENSSSADSTSSTTPATSDYSEGEPVSITADEAKKVEQELFFFLRNRFLEGDVIAYKEELTVNRNQFKYRLLRHNLDNAGMKEEESEGKRSPTEEEFEEDSTREWVTYTEVYQTYVSEIDTFEIVGKYQTWLKSAPESTPKILHIILEGTETYFNTNYVRYGEPVFSGREEYALSVNPFDVDMSKPSSTGPDDLYIIAKIRELTDDDLKILSKQELSFVRNDIFAHHGHSFKTPAMVGRYEKQSWYHSLVDDASSLLNNFEKTNVEFIKKREG